MGYSAIWTNNNCPLYLLKYQLNVSNILKNYNRGFKIYFQWTRRVITIWSINRWRFKWGTRHKQKYIFVIIMVLSFFLALHKLDSCASAYYYLGTRKYMEMCFINTLVTVIRAMIKNSNSVHVSAPKESAVFNAGRGTIHRMFEVNLS